MGGPLVWHKAGIRILQYELEHWILKYILFVSLFVYIWINLGGLRIYYSFKSTYWDEGIKVNIFTSSYYQWKKKGLFRFDRCIYAAKYRFVFYLINIYNY